MSTVSEAIPDTSPRSGDGRPPPHWAVRIAHLIGLLTLPSGLWRVGVALGFSMGIRVDGAPVTIRGWEAAYVLGLSLFSEGVALLSLGLVRPWGELFPRRLPVIGGRRVPPVAATALAATGAVALTAIWTYATVGYVADTVSGAPEQGFVFSGGWWEVLIVACYLPLLLWGPLLLVLTRAYHRRRGDPRRETP